MVDITSLWRKLVGGEEPAPTPVAPPPPTVYSASPLSAYPSPEDAAFARQSGFGYGTPAESYIQGNLARVVGQPQGKLKTFVPGSLVGMDLADAAGAGVNPRLSQNVDLTNPANTAVKDTMGTILAQAALAANRIPIAALGFDPSRTAFDTKLKNSNIAGAYSPSDDSLFSNVNERDPSTIVHESTHRGMAQLRKDPALADIFKNLPTEEYVVRYLMATQAGDPEKGGGTTGDKQREAALKILGHDKYQSDLDKLNQAAQAAIAARRPMGPR